MLLPADSGCIAGALHQITASSYHLRPQLFPLSGRRLRPSRFRCSAAGNLAIQPPARVRVPLQFHLFAPGQVERVRCCVGAHSRGVCKGIAFGVHSPGPSRRRLLDCLSICPRSRSRETE